MDHDDSGGGGGEQESGGDGGGGGEEVLQLELQLFFLISLAAITCLAYFIPFWLLTRYGYSHVLGSSSSSRLVSLTNSLSCGILLGTCFLGMWPAAESKWEEAKAAGPSSSSAAEAADRGWSRRGGSEEGGPESVRSRVPWHNAMVLVGFCAVFSLQQILSAMGKSVDESGGERRDEIEQEGHEAEEDPWNGDKPMLHEAASALEQRHRETRRRRRRGYGSMDQDHTCDAASAGAATKSGMSGLETFCLVLVVSWHNILEGFSLGVQRDPATAKALFAGIAAHAALMASAVTLVAGAAWIAAGWTNSRISAVLAAMVLTRPIGMVAGMFLDAASSSSPAVLFVTAVLQSLSVGLFLHLIFMGIIPAEFRPRRSEADGGGDEKVWLLCTRLGLIVLGWSAFLLLVASLGHDHGGGDPRHKH